MLTQLHGNLIVILQTYVSQNLKVLIVKESTETILSNLVLMGGKWWSRDKSKVKGHLIVAPLTRKIHIH